MVPYATLRLRLFPHLRWGFANYSITVPVEIRRQFGLKSGDKDLGVADQIFHLPGCLYHNSTSKY